MRTPEEGIQGGERAREVRGPEYHAGRVSAAASLTDLVGEYAFFTHAVFFTHADFDCDPVWDFVVDWEAEHQPFHLDFPRPLFSGLAGCADPAWNHRLLASPLERWRELDGFLNSVSGVDRRQKKFWRALSQVLPVPDGLALHKAATLPIPCPMVDVIVFGVSGNDQLVVFEPAYNPPVDLPRVVIRPPEESTVQLARTILGEDDKPFRVIERQGSS